MSAFGGKADTSFTFPVQQPLMRVTIVATSIRLADVGGYCLGIFMLGPKGRDQSVLASIVKTLERALCLRPTMYEVMSSLHRCRL